MPKTKKVVTKTIVKKSKPLEKRVARILTVFAALVTITGVSLATLLKPVYMPNVVGMDPNAAEATLSEAGFSADVTGEGDVVVSESPDANTRQFKWTHVSLHVEQGLNKYTWDQLADISGQIAAANSKQEALSIAAKFELCNKD